jgi:metacaspase-1
MSMGNKMQLMKAAWCALALLPLGAVAEQRALLVGVGKYVMPGIDLPGIDLDLERMHETLNRMGFTDAQIHTLTNDDATSTRVLAEMDGWLRQGVKPGDRVVFYFSGHGSQVPDFNGDEDDGVDEVLVTHDMQRGRKQGKATLLGVVVDDDIDAEIAKNPSRNVLMIFDACHSGTVSRSFSLHNRSVTSDPVFVKSFNYPGMPEPTPGVKTRDIKQSKLIPGNSSNFVAISAAGDRESAIGTSRGGMFTIGVTEAIARLSTEGKSITPVALRDEAAAYIKTKVDKDQLYTPQVTGSATLADTPLKIATASVTNGPNRKKLADLVAAQSNHVTITPSATHYAVGEAVKLTLNLPAAGYLNIVTVDAKDGATVLFPNRYQDSNAVQAGAFQLPTPQMAFNLEASEPLGSTLVVAFLSSDPINFFKETLDNRDENGNINADFAALSHTATRAIRVTPRKNETYGGQVELQIDAATKRP